MGNMKLVCFDLDDTLIREIHSVMLPCILNGKEKEHSFIQMQEEEDFIDYISADYQRAQLLLGLEEYKIENSTKKEFSSPYYLQNQKKRYNNRIEIFKLRFKMLGLIIYGS